MVAIISGGRDPYEAFWPGCSVVCIKGEAVAPILNHRLLFVVFLGWLFFSGGVLGAYCIHTDRCTAIRRHNPHVDTKHNSTYIISTLLEDNGSDIINQNYT